MSREVTDPRTEALRVYAEIHERFAELEQILMGEGRVYEAQGYHVYALRILRAWIAEQYDPVPDGLTKVEH